MPFATDGDPEHPSPSGADHFRVRPPTVSGDRIVSCRLYPVRSSDRWNIGQDALRADLPEGGCRLATAGAARKAMPSSAVAITRDGRGRDVRIRFGTSIPVKTL